MAKREYKLIDVATRLNVAVDFRPGAIERLESDLNELAHERWRLLVCDRDLWVLERDAPPPPARPLPRPGHG